MGAGRGAQAICDTFRHGAARIEVLPWEILHIVADGDVALTGRVDGSRAGETRIRVPCLGIFELCGRLIAAWRDDWDLAHLERQLSEG